MKNILLLFIISISLTFKSWAQQIENLELQSFKNEKFGLNLQGGLGYNLYMSEFSQFQGAVDCGTFESGNGMGPLFIIGGEYLLNPKSAFGLNIGYFDRGGTFEKDNSFFARNSITGGKEEVKTLNAIDINLNYLVFGFEYRHLIKDKFINGPLRVVVGPRFEIPLTAEFTQYEQTVSPDGAVFIDPNTGAKKRRRDIAGGDIVTITNAMGLSLGLENHLKLGEHSTLTQQLAFDYNFNNMLDETQAKWGLFAVRFTVGVRFGFAQEEDAPVVIIPEPTPEPEPVKEEIIVKEEPPAPVVPEIEFEIDRTLENGKLLTGNEIISTIPLVNSVFFGKNSSDIPKEYELNTTTDTFFEGDPIYAHYSVMPRIANIIKANPTSSVTIQAYTSGKENEPAGIELAQKRVDNLKNTLIDLGVPANKIDTKAMLEPVAKSNQDYAEGIAENQRADFFIKNAALQEYVDIQKFAEISGIITGELNTKNIPSNEKLNFSNSLTNETLDIENNKSIKVPIKTRVELDSDGIEFASYVSYKDTKTQTTKKIDINSLKKEQVQLNLENFEAILRFDYNSSKLSDENKALLTQLADKLPENVTIMILGSSDALGSAEVNIALAKARAEETEKFLKSLPNLKQKISTSTTNKKFDEATPQGRFLNRSIRIKVTK